jgi:hypothetical protein
MPPEPTPLSAAAKRKSDHTRARASDALRELDQQGRAITFQSVARQAGVYRQWLYQQPELRKEIERLRDRSIANTRPGVPDAQRATMASLHQRNTLLLAENRRLREEVAELKAELAIAYGQRRAGRSA